jgi:GTP cyclohydrolase I
MFNSAMANCLRYCSCGWTEATAAEEAAKVLLQHTTGLDISSEHGAQTPERFMRMLKELTTAEEFTFTTFPSEGIHDMIVVQDIPFVSVCNHHVIPFVGKVHVAYVPNDMMAGLSKFARLVKFYAKRLQVQERLTVQIADEIEHELAPLGVGVVIQAEHFCMTIRGVQTPGTLTTTAAMRGVFADHDKTAKSEFMSIIGL